MTGVPGRVVVPLPKQKDLRANFRSLRTQQRAYAISDDRSEVPATAGVAVLTAGVCITRTS
jgi:hypothetical protein